MSLRSLKHRFAGKKQKSPPVVVKVEEQREEPGPLHRPAYPELSLSIAENIRTFKNLVGDGGDIKVHEFRFGADRTFHGALLFVDGLVSMDQITEGIMKPMLWDEGAARKMAAADDLIATVKETVLCSGDITESGLLSDLIAQCMVGDTVIIVDGCERGIVVSTKGWDKRAVSDPQTEAVIRGPREAFTENLRTNTALMRRRIKNPQLRMEHMVIGVKTLTDVCLAYIDGVADPKVISELKYRLEQIRVDAILDSGYIEQYIEDAPLSLFPTVSYTEKPDVAAAQVLEGRIAIIVDGSPFVLSVPMLFIESFQTAEDYYGRVVYASISRFMRYLAFMLTIFMPSLYIALVSFHQELIPTTLLFTFAAAREGTPFPALLEALIMVFSFEILREAGVRLPRPVGQAISIVGALIVGDAAVSAGIVGAPMVIAIAITAVAGFVVPEQADAAAVLRLVTMFFAASLGIFGITVVFLAILIHLCSLESFGVPYFSALLPSRDARDTLVRFPLWAMTKRPRDIARGDITRLRFFVPPLRPHRREEGGEDQA